MVVMQAGMGPCALRRRDRVARFALGHQRINRHRHTGGVDHHRHPLFPRQFRAMHPHHFPALGAKEGLEPDLRRRPRHRHIAFAAREGFHHRPALPACHTRAAEVPPLDGNRIDVGMQGNEIIDPPRAQFDVEVFIGINVQNPPRLPHLRQLKGHLQRLFLNAARRIGAGVVVMLDRQKARHGIEQPVGAI